MTSVRFELDPNWEQELEESVDMEGFLQEVGDQVADNARGYADASWEGASRIFAEVRRAEDVGAATDTGLVVDVSWEEQDYGMGFNETGTEDQRPRPFLLPGLEGTSI